MFREPTESEWESWQEELRRCFVRMQAEKREEYKPTLIERIICKLKFNQLKKGMK